MTTSLSIPLADTWGMHGDDVGTGWMILMGAGMMLFWVPIVLGILWFARRIEPASPAPSDSPASRENPVEILERRFAEGAISEEDYRARRKVLVNGRADPKGAAADKPAAATHG